MKAIINVISHPLIFAHFLADEFQYGGNGHSCPRDAGYFLALAAEYQNMVIGFLELLNTISPSPIFRGKKQMIQVKHIFLLELQSIDLAHDPNDYHDG
jgi:hypothetical protein